MKTCCCTVACKTGQWTPEQIIDLAAGLGFDGVELWGRFLEDASDERLREIRTHCDSAGLSVPLISPYMGFFDLGKSNYHEMVDECRKFLGISGKMGVKQVRSFAGFVSEITSESCDDANWAYAINGFMEYAALAEQAGVDILLETHTRSLVDCVQSIEKLLEAVPSRRLRLNFQLDDMVSLSKMEPEEIWSRLGSRVAHFHYRCWSDPIKREHTKRIFACMKRDEWDGFISIEYVDGEKTADGIARVGIERLREDWD
jgi:sugar phosphate isomerase/epimerase